MAEGNPPVESKILCRYFVHGVCKNGSYCRFSHDKNDKADNICKFYLRGCCSYADRCRYEHTKPKPNDVNRQKFEKNVYGLSVPPPQSYKTENNESNGMVSLKKVLKGDVTPSTPKSPENWVNAAEFIPGQRYISSTVPSSYANAATKGVETKDLTIYGDTDINYNSVLCPYSINKPCPYGDDCEYIHGEKCDLCGLAILLPDDKLQQQQHKQECLAQHERDMELSFAIANSKDKQCGICMDIVIEKQPKSEQRFGILSDCTHCFCLSCIRKWRASKQFDNKTIRSCPECRIQSDFVTPSSHWVEKKEEKLKLIEGYKDALSKKPCKYFDEGRSECPFNNRCFYQHLLPDGSKPPPSMYNKPRRRRHNADGELTDQERIFLWDFFEERQDLESFLLFEYLEDDLTSLLLSLHIGADSSDDSDSNYW
ncbi:E3 ubiquitin-protein ligase makorin-1 [Mactra antiquata]